MRMIGKARTSQLSCITGIFGWMVWRRLLRHSRPLRYSAARGVTDGQQSSDEFTSTTPGRYSPYPSNIRAYPALADCRAASTPLTRLVEVVVNPKQKRTLWIAAWWQKSGEVVATQSSSITVS